MLRSLHAAASGMSAQQFKIDTIANNLANASTPGFKKSRAEFQELLHEQLEAPGGQPLGVSIGGGVRPIAAQRLFDAGALQHTGQPLDLAISGPGFFRLQGPAGEYYTRAGSFRRDAEGHLVDAGGRRLLGAAGPVQLPAGAEAVTIDAEGRISVTVGAEAMTAGQLELVQFTNPGGLLAVGDSLFAATAQSGAQFLGPAGGPGQGQIVQGYLEQSNVEVLAEMVGLITAQRVYELNSRVVQGADEMLGLANNLRR